MRYINPRFTYLLYLLTYSYTQLTFWLFCYCLYVYWLYHCTSC